MDGQPGHGLTRRRVSLTTTRRALLGLGAAAVVGAGVAAEASWRPDAAPPGAGVGTFFGMRTDPRRTYAHLPGRAGRVDLFTPGGRGPFPVLAWTGGSGWRSDRGYEGGREVARGMIPEGYAVAAFSVRSSAQAVFPAQVEDATACVRWLRSHARELDLDPGRIALGGTSSGGWNALLAGLTGARDLDRDAVPPPGSEVPAGGHAIPAADAVQAIVDFFAPVDFLSMNVQMPPGACAALNREQRLTHCQLDDASTKSLMLGAPVMLRGDLVRLASPRTHLSAAAPPTLVVHGTSDRTVPWRQSEGLYAALAAQGVPSAFYTVEAAGHDLGMLRGRGSPARVQRTALPPSAVHPEISWGAVAAFLDVAMPAPPGR